MAHWKHDNEREDCDTHDETRQAVFDARKWLRGVAARSQSPTIRGMVGDLRALELAAGPYFLGIDYDDDDRDDDSENDDDRDDDSERDDDSRD